MSIEEREAMVGVLRIVAGRGPLLRLLRSLELAVEAGGGCELPTYAKQLQDAATTFLRHYGHVDEHGDPIEAPITSDAAEPVGGAR